MPRKWSSLAIALLVASCGPGPGSDADAGTDAETDESTECLPTSGTDLEGWWALRAYVRLEMHEDPTATVHVCDDPPYAMATLTWVVHLGAASGSSMPLSFRTCEILLPQVTASFAECSMDETFVAYLLTSETLDESLPLSEHTGEARLSEEGGCASLSTRDLFVRIGIPADFDDAVPLPGWDLECSGTTALECVPGFETDVLDTDSDGNPGATFEIDTDPAGLVEGVAWATLRHTPNPSATVTGNVLLTGDLEPLLEYDFVGSDAQMAGLDIDTPTVKRNLPDFVPTPEGSRFVMVRADGAGGSTDLTAGDGVLDCPEVLAASGLFE